jgi:tRNA pseudouridine38-40 synthase
VSRNIKLTIEYDGTGFSGWQRLRGRPSIQAEIERAIHAVTKEKVNVIGAGRTDAGVHALGQVASFPTEGRLAATRFPGALNAHLPPAIRVLGAEEADGAFHARYAATGRVYRYAVLNRPQPSAILRHHALHVPRPLDDHAIAHALEALLGTHPFTAFRATGSGERTTVCTMHRAHVARSGDMLIFTFEADRFLRHMVRLIVGTLLKVGEGKLPLEAVAEILDAEDTARAGPRAPAHGLFLVRVTY